MIIAFPLSVIHFIAFTLGNLTSRSFLLNAWIMFDFSLIASNIYGKFLANTKSSKKITPAD